MFPSWLSAAVLRGPPCNWEVTDHCRGLSTVKPLQEWIEVTIPFALAAALRRATGLGYDLFMQLRDAPKPKTRNRRVKVQRRSSDLLSHTLPSRWQRSMPAETRPPPRFRI